MSYDDLSPKDKHFDYLVIKTTLDLKDIDGITPDNK
jgi:hypothetical protein